MPLVDPQILGQRQSPDLMGAYQQGLQTRGLLRRDNAEQQKAQRMKAFEQAFDQASRGLDLTNAENMGNVLKQTFQMFPEETMETAKKYADAFPRAAAAKSQWDNLAGAETPTLYNRATGETKATGVAGKPAKSAEPSAYEIAKDKWERGFKERQLRASMENTAKDNDLAAAKAEIARQKAEAEMARKAVDVDEVAAQADAAVSLIDQMIGSEDGTIKRHPGFKGAVGAKGMSSLFGLKDKPIAGTDAAGFAALYEQVKGGAFLEAVQKMKGSGALSDTEGKAAANAITRMQTSTSEAEFEAAAKEFRAAIKGRKGRVMEKAAAKAPGLIVTPHAQDSTGWTQIAPGIRVRKK